MSANVYRTAATGIGAIAETFIVPVGQTYRVVSVTLHLNAASVTHENFTLTLDAVNGAAYDTVLYFSAWSGCQSRLTVEASVGSSRYSTVS